MVRYFFEIKEDELFYSVLARYKDDTLKTTQAVLLELFGTTIIDIHPLLPERLKIFCEKISLIKNFDPEDIFNNHSILPLYHGLIRDFRYQYLKEATINGLRRKLPRNFLSTERYHFKYCPLCKSEDERSSGETYWRRTHQIPYLTICPIHNCFLKNWASLKNTYGYHNQLYSASSVLEKDNSYVLNTDFNLLRDSKKLSELMGQKTQSHLDFQAIIKRAEYLGIFGNGFNYNNKLRMSFDSYINPTNVIHANTHESNVIPQVRGILNYSDKYLLNPLLLVQFNSFLEKVELSLGDIIN